MRAYEVFLNGERLCIAGVPGEGTSTIEVSDFKKNEVDDEARLDVRAFEYPTREYLSWTNAPLSLGDEVRLRVLESNSVDEPKARRREDPEVRAKELEERKTFVRAWAKKFGWTVIEPPYTT
jgi:hypothetical protein